MTTATEWGLRDEADRHFREHGDLMAEARRRLDSGQYEESYRVSQKAWAAYFRGRRIQQRADMMIAQRVGA